MSTVSEATIEELKARVDLADLIASYGIEVKSAGSSKKACCPFHHEKTPSFNINENKGFYHCFGCGESGDAIKFVMKMEGLGFMDAVRKLAEQVGMKIEEKTDPEAVRRARLLALLSELAQFYHRCLLQTKEGELARKYLTERDLTARTVEDYLIGYAPSGVANILKWAEKHAYTPEELQAAGVIIAPNRPGDRGYHRFGGRLMFTIRDKRGRVVGFSGRQLVPNKNSGKYVNSPETDVFKKSNILYGFDKAMLAISRAPNREVIICEGQIDCIRLQTSGFPNAVAGQGTAFTAEHVRMLKQVTEQVALVYDDDGAGHNATIKSARLLLAAEIPVRVVSLPNGDDPDSFLRTHPADDFRILLDGAESIMTFQVRAERAKEKKPDSVDAINRISKEILKTIAQCPNAILRASMADEAAKLLDLPRAAFEDSLMKVRSAESAKSARAASVREERREEPAEEPSPDFLPESEGVTDAPDAGNEAAAVIPPPREELAFCEFLMGNEETPDAKTIDGMIGEFLPERLFSHDFTRTFVKTWREEQAKGDYLLAGWGDTLGKTERAWFDSALLGQGKALESGLSPSDIAQDFVRALWIAHLRRVRGDLPAHGDAETDAMRMQLTMGLKRLASARWPNVKEMVADWIGRKI